MPAQAGKKTKGNKSTKSRGSKGKYVSNKSNIKSVVASAIKATEEAKKAPILTLANNVQVYGNGLNYNGVGLLNGWSTIVGAGVIPLVAQGTGQNGRVGNVINPKYFDITYSLRALPTTDTGTISGNNNPFRAKAFLVRVIVYRHRYAIDDFGQQGIMEEGGASADLSGNPQQWLEKFNRDEYIIKYVKTYKMAADNHNTGSPNFTYIDQMANGHKSFVFGKIQMKLPAKLIYNDTLNQPTNCAYYMAVAVANQDSSAISTSQTRISVSARSFMTYTDS